MKKLVSLMLVLALAVLCGAAFAEGVSADSIKIGYIFIGDENEGYTAAHYYGAQAMMEALGISEDQVTFKWTIPETEECLDAAIDLADSGCNIIFANSFGHETYMMQAASEYPDVQFCHATGYQAAASGMPNMHNYFTNIFESRYVSGVVAGMKLAEMIANGEIAEDAAKIGYVGAYPYAEIVSGYTAFFLGARSACPSATMVVKYTNSWASFDLEKEAADALISQGCVLIGQHADTTGAPTACQAAGVPNVGYNISMIATAPDAALTSAANNWGAYYTYAVQSVIDGTEIPADWADGYATGTVNITELNENTIAAGTVEKVAEIEAALAAGELKVFATDTYTIGGETIEALMESDAENYGKYAAYVSDGYFHESELASAPSFDLRIDGIEELG